MIKVSVLYPNGEGKTFDMEYYLGTHIPMVLQLLGDACKNGAAEQGIAGGTPGSAPTYTAMGHMYFETLEDFNGAFSSHANEIMGDIPNYTNIAPVFQVSEVKL
jgi:uncharacterized protein (TIGR02118 family)